MKKVGKTTKLFRYDLNQIPYNYTVEVTNRFKGLDLIDKVPEELWREVKTLYRRQGTRPPPRKRNAERQDGSLRRPYKELRKEEVKGKGKKERYTHLNAEFQRIVRRDKKDFLSDQCKEIEEN